MANPEVEPVEQTATWGESCTVGDGGSGSSPGDIDPDGGDVAHGWPDTDNPPPRQRWNWILGWLMQAARYVLRSGVPRYKSTRSYLTGDITNSSGVLYVALQNSTGQTPASSPTYWAVYPQHATGALASNTITADGGSVVTNVRQICHPGVTDKIVMCTLEMHAVLGVFTTTLSLSMELAARFANVVDHVVMTARQSNAHAVGGTFSYTTGVMGDGQAVIILGLAGPGDTSTDPMYLDVVIFGH